MMVGVFAVLAEYDREINRERQDHGRELAKQRGTHMGRKPGLDAAKLARVKTALEAGLSVAKVVQLTGIPESTVKRYKRTLENPAG